ncbi:MAG: PAS domain-containing sensor histidine kinase [Sphingomonas sp. 28-66-16]|nr:MAG: PAS domain-containing sensor histidine kinase [Sphingomonas sp. 28-66-16]
MNAIDPQLPVVRGVVGYDGRLVEADLRLHDLNLRAGGAIGAPIAVPPLATLVRLARRLGILVSRSIVAADGDDDIEMWVRAEPDPAADVVRLAISGWKTRTAWQPTADEDVRARDFLRSAAAWTWETDAALRLTQISIIAGARHGFDSQALLGQPLTRLFILGEADTGMFPILGALAMRQRFDDQPAMIRETGRPVLLSATPRLNASGGFAGLVGATLMVDPVDKPATTGVAVTRSGLPEAFSERLDRALRAPLGRIIANADSINAKAEGPLRQDYADYAADIATAGRHLLGLVDDLVDLQAIERPDFVVAAEPIDLADIARRAAGLLQVRAAAANVRIDRPPLDEALPATGEFRRTLQILVNLIGNAVRYSPDEAMVWIRAERDGPMAAVVVADQGRGIAIEDQARIFEKFERVDTSEPGGSGLGLYIARRLARAMGGDVTVDSAPGQGARFVLTLPYRE